MGSNQEIKMLHSWLLVVAVVLFVAIIPIWPYGFYTLLRLLVCGITAFIAYKIHKNFPELGAHKIALVIIAVLFNPLFPVYLVRFIWMPVDIGIGIYLLALRKKIK